MVTHDPGRRRPRRPPDHPARRQDRPRRRPGLGRRGDRADEADRLARDRLALKSLWARKVRALATTFAVVIGVAFVAGSYVLTDTIFAAFDEIFSESLKGTSVVITREEPGQTGKRRSADDQRLAAAAGAEDARACASPPGRSSPPAASSTPKGDKIGNKFAPKFISSTLPDGLESLTYVEGHRPRGPTEASIDKAAAERLRPEAGRKDRASSARAAPQAYRLVGFTQLGSASFGGASIAQVTLPVAQRSPTSAAASTRSRSPPTRASRRRR